MEYFLHPNGLCESTSVGARTRIWAFAHVLAGAVIGTDCNINDGVFIENDVRIGDRVTVKSGVQLWDGVTLEDDVFVGPNATFTNDPFPRSKRRPEQFDRTIIRQGASVGGNSTILPGLTVGRFAMVGAGSVVTRDVPEYAIVMGNPARVVGYTDTVSQASDEAARVGRGSVAVHAADVAATASGARLIELTTAVDMRGELVAGQVGSELPFVPQRFFVVHQVPSAHVRGAHAHLHCEQVLVCLVGSVNALVDDGTSRVEFLLNSPSTALYMPALTWGTQYQYSADAVLLVLASQPYDVADYVRDYDEFRAIVAARSAS
ncbi:MAG TPA: WxcM-like domain-containing protein [Ilumatobacteraceae bacterium]|nr:WxcM-like domain-containing protein [Ilumatobacteraceae bacterium]